MREELSYFLADLLESNLEIFYENRTIKIIFDNKYSRYLTSVYMKTVDGSLSFRVHIPEPCSKKDFGIIKNILSDILDVKIV